MMDMIRLNLYLNLFTRTLKVCLAAMLAQLVFACSEISTSDVALGSAGQQGITIPERVRMTAIAAEGTLNAFLYCDEVRQPMIISDDIAQGSCTGLSTTSLHKVRVEFDFTSETFGGSFVVATATKEGVRAESGGTDLSFVSGDFDTSMDNDGDLISNLTELENGTNPGQPICVIGLSIIGSCIL